MITKASIKRFKCFDHFEIDSLSRITLIGGKNNAGKTSLLEGLFLLFDRSNPNSLFRQYAWRGVDTISFAPEDSWGPAFHGYDLDLDVEISEFFSDSTEERLNLHFNPNFDISAVIPDVHSMGDSIKISAQDVPNHSLEIEVLDGKGRVQKSRIYLTRNGPRMYPKLDSGHPSHFIASRSKGVHKEDAQLFGQFEITDRVDTLVQFMNKMESDLEDLAVIQGGEASFINAKMRDLPRKLPISFAGEGMARLLSIMLRISGRKGAVVFIDEAENGVHHSVQVPIWKAIHGAAVENDCQVIASTHSDEFISSVHKAMSGGSESDFSYYRLDKKGSTVTATRYGHDEYKNSDVLGLEVR